MIDVSKLSPEEIEDLEKQIKAHKNKPKGTNYLELQPGTIWIQNKREFNKATLIVKIEQAPFCRIQPCYGRTHDGYAITEPPYEGAPAVEMITYNRMPQIVYRYLICDSPKHLNKMTTSHANGFTYYYRRIH